MKRNKLKRHLETLHAECVGKSLKFFHRKLNEFNKQEQAFAKITIFDQNHSLCHSNFQICFITYLGALQKQFSLYFQDVAVSKFGLETHLPVTASLD
jgi:hypothetical protein